MDRHHSFFDAGMSSSVSVTVALAVAQMYQIQIHVPDLPYHVRRNDCGVSSSWASLKADGQPRTYGQVTVGTQT